MLTALLLLQVLVAGGNADPFRFFQPSVTITADDRRKIERGEAIARPVDAGEKEVAILAAMPVNVDGDRLTAWMRQIQELKKSAYVVSIGRFSNPPRIADLSRLALDEDELSAVRKCRPKSCDLKLSAREMTALQAAAKTDGDWEAAMQQAFREAVLERVRMYLATGEIPPYESGKNPVRPSERFASLLQHSMFLTQGSPDFSEHLRAYPAGTMPGVESFLYWSKERLAGKATVSVTHVNILRSSDAALPDALVAAKQIFSTHYINASLGTTAIMRGEPGRPNYLVYLNRSELDVLGGRFGGIVRWFVQRRLKSEAAGVLRGLRQRLEQGEPPSATSSRDPLPAVRRSSTPPPPARPTR